MFGNEKDDISLSDDSFDDFVVYECLKKRKISENVPPVYTSSKVTSSHDIKSYNLIDCVDSSPTSLICLWANVQSLERYVITETVPWHIQCNCTFIVDMNSLVNRSDITIDAWEWSNCKTYVSSGSSLKDCFMKGNDASKMRFLKRSWKCKQDSDLMKVVATLYQPGKKCTNPNDSFRACERFAIIQYQFKNKEKEIKPAKRCRIYPSVKEKIRDNLKKGSGPKKAVFQTQKDLGGLDNISNKSYIASTKLAKNLSRSIRENLENTDPLKALIERQHQQGTTGHPVIRRITIDEISYSVCLFSDRILHNLANFCCTEIREYKSAFCNDFTFNLMKNPPCFALIGTYNNTSIESIRGGSCPAMLGPAIICHFKTERVVKWLFDSLVEECPGLEPYIQVLKGG